MHAWFQVKGHVQPGINTVNNMERITIAHGSGGKITHELIKNTFFSILGNDVLNNADDSALLKKDTKDIAFTTDSFVIKPIFGC